MMSMCLPQPAELAPRLLCWFDQAKRDLPWRGVTDPYCIWVSEIMLQQTQVATVIPYYKRFLAAFSTVEALAAAPLDEVLALWAGLGYYSRARNLHRAAALVVSQHNARFPECYQAARALPGIGEYTAGAILSMAYGVRLPALDGNAFRVLARVWGVLGDVAQGESRRRLVAIGREAVPALRSGDYNQALMEQGSQVCLPGQPRCRECCLVDICVARRQGLEETIPPPRRANTQNLAMSAVVVHQKGSVLLAKRPAKGVWGGLWELPHIEGGEEALRLWLQNGFGLTLDKLVEFTRFSYGIMDKRVTLRVYRSTSFTGKLKSPYGEPLTWLSASDCESIALPAPHRKILRRLVEHLHSGQLEV